MELLFRREILGKVVLIPVAILNKVRNPDSPVISPPRDDICAESFISSRYAMLHRILITCLVLALLILPTKAIAGENGAKNIILFIGDGMGWAHIAAARSFVYGAAGELHMERLGHSGYVSIFSLHSLITDSAASATAMATGHKTRRGIVGQSEQGEEYKTILEIAKEMGKSTGLVTTTEVTHATPAAFAAHEPSRDNARAIAEDYLHRSQPDVIMGGGAWVWTHVLTKEARDVGYEIVYTKRELEHVDTSQMDRLLGLFAPSHMSFAMDRRQDEPSLIEMSIKALEILSRDPDGFFLMIEGGRIDHAGHNNDRVAVIYETVAFDETVGAVMEWLEAHGLADETLVIVTSDHETGGLAVTGPKGHLPKRGEKPEAKWAHDYHTAEDVPIWAEGPGAEAVRGHMDNTEVFRVMEGALRVTTPGERP